MPAEAAMATWIRHRAWDRKVLSSKPSLYISFLEPKRNAKRAGAV